ncbi:MAG: cytotoxic translational repressor of toxin-antitoxin stability system [Thermodesulfobacteriota bacterium]|nr:cytotoxic translational repressor of toxin-antitoxin stability system [Thermodesulfobacteriota bacterium]
MEWQVVIPRRIMKMVDRLPDRPKKALFVLMKEIEEKGPARGNWPNYSKLKNQLHHCHLKKGKPTYVAVWQVVDNEIRLVEVVYAGTHEKAPY